MIPKRGNRSNKTPKKASKDLTSNIRKKHTDLFVCSITYNGQSTQKIYCSKNQGGSER